MSYKAGEIGADLREDAPSRDRYVIVTPARNEENNLEETIRCVANQTVRPEEWVIVNDGSTDATTQILDRYAAEYPWIRVFHLPDRGRREPGGGVIRAFNHGLREVRSQNWSFLVKFDADLKVDPDYFAQCFDEFHRDSTLAIGGGIICHRVDGTLHPDVDPSFHVRGATKIYRRAFWEMSGGLVAAPGWDTIDELKANMLGWTTRTFPHVRLEHQRTTGAADGAWRNWFKNGLANYITGYHPLFMTVKCVKRIRQRPFVVAGVGLFCGFMSGYWKRVPQVEDKALIHFVREQQIRRLTFRKSLWN